MSDLVTTGLSLESAAERLTQATGVRVTPALLRAQGHRHPGLLRRVGKRFYARDHVVRRLILGDPLEAIAADERDLIERERAEIIARSSRIVALT